MHRPWSVVTGLFYCRTHGTHNGNILGGILLREFIRESTVKRSSACRQKVNPARPTGCRSARMCTIFSVSPIGISVSIASVIARNIGAKSGGAGHVGRTAELSVPSNITIYVVPPQGGFPRLPTPRRLRFSLEYIYIYRCLVPVDAWHVEHLVHASDAERSSHTSGKWCACFRVTPLVICNRVEARI